MPSIIGIISALTGGLYDRLPFAVCQPIVTSVGLLKLQMCVYDTVPRKVTLFRLPFKSFQEITSFICEHTPVLRTVCLHDPSDRDCYVCVRMSVCVQVCG